jgi:hypothetical protein
MSRAGLALALLLAAPVFADEPSWKKAVDVTGYVDSRSSYSRSRTWGLIPTDDQPQLQELLELNTQLKVSVRPHTFGYADVSLLVNFAGNYRSSNAAGEEVVVADHKTAASLPIVSLNEAYLSHEFMPQLNVLLGKKRVVWGPGLAFNPTDLLNPRRDPTDPTLQRAGAWLAQVEAPFERVTLTVLFSPTVTEQASGLPMRFLTYPTWDLQDDQVHYQVAARAYTLVADTDVNLMLFYGNRSTDALGQKLRVGLSASHVFFSDTEVHAEALGQTGSARDFLNGPCVATTAAALGCATAKTAFIGKPYLDDGTVQVKALFGVRKQFTDDAMLSAEYLLQTDGWHAADYQRYANALDLVAQGRAAGLSVNRIPGASALLGTGTTTDGLPARVAFDPRGRHYAFLTWSVQHLLEDFTFQAVLIANLVDLSTLWTPSLAWSPTDWLTLTLYGFLPLPGPDALAAKTSANVRVSEYGTLPFAWRALFEVRAFF